MDEQRKASGFMFVTDESVLAQIASEIVDLMCKYEVRRTEVSRIMESVHEQLSWQPVLEAKRYPNSHL